MVMKKAYELKAEHLKKEFAKRNIESFYCSTKEDAVAKITDMIEDGKSVTWGGSTTLAELGIKGELEKGNYNVIDRDKFAGAERMAKMREAFSADYYLTSSNALTLDGQLVNIDGTGNRVAAISFGPDKVIFIVGINKVVKTLDQAYDRIRNVATAPNALRLNLDTPCAKTGVCHDCLSKDCICSQVLVTRYNRIDDRIKVIIVGESLGF
jgi:L-lactate utilization protein LutB